MNARRVSFVIAAALLASGAAFADNAPKPLNETELREIIVGGDVALDEQGGAFQESFCATGDWSVAGARTPISGRYAIEGDTVCIEGASSRQCYRFYISDKQYFRRWTESASQEYERVSIQPASC